NGAFLAFLPLPADGVWRLRARRGGEEVEHAAAYRVPATGAADSVVREVFPAPRAGTVTGGADTLATGSDAIPARPTPGGTYRWFLPRGARVAVVERRGDQYRVQLDPATAAWVSRESVALDDGAPPAAAPLGAVTVRPAAEWVDVRVSARHAPFLVEADSAGLHLTVHGATPGGAPAAPGDALLTAVLASAAGPAATRLDLLLARPVWGYKAFYEADGTLVLRVRRPPAIDPANPLRGIRIVVDPGHPPAGTIGPTGFTEAEANLAIALPLAELLRQRGAEVHLTRTQNVEVALGERTALAVRTDAHLLVSVHNNAFGEGVNPFRGHGTGTYYFHPLSAGLARALQGEIVRVTGIPDQGARVSNLALARPTWMPSALTESLFMLIPEQEAALRDPAFARRLAEAHARGIEVFLTAVLSPES
ncbi:MAG TPA: N-acetylmuramoyl-L-alanine amidase, partial [Longimicrobiaceae bacterium]|nr:N-acetylmuramoyl-L-alanine amidase [Longimicrobiaceae bacterium]